MIVLAAVGFGGFYCWAQQRGLLTADQAAEGRQGTRRISLLTEAAAYAGVILLLVGGVTAISQRWNDIGRGGQGGVLAAAAVFFFLVGIIVRQVREPAIQRLAGVAWFLSVAGVAGAVWLALYHVHGKTTRSRPSPWGGCHLVRGGVWLIRRARWRALPCSRAWSSPSSALPRSSLSRPGPVRFPRLPDLPTPLLAIALPLWVFGLHGRGSGGGGTPGPCG